MHKLLIDMLSHFERKDAKNWDKYVPLWHTEPRHTVLQNTRPTT
jgi:hypothetical protein